uniref:Putative secreted protein n=1 Tax=Ixodes ricinus TaxID=34613 RepID=A0A6B0V6S5_IXORI
MTALGLALVLWVLQPPVVASRLAIGDSQPRGVENFLMSAVQSLLEKSHTALLKLADRMPNLVPRMDAQECLKRTICEAHNRPGRYGIVGVALQLIFPPFKPGAEETAQMTPLQLAAKYGRGSGADCGRQYDGCFLDVLQTMQGVVDYAIRRQRKTLNAAHNAGVAHSASVVHSASVAPSAGGAHSAGGAGTAVAHNVGVIHGVGAATLVTVTPATRLENSDGLSEEEYEKMHFSRWRLK